MKKIYYSKICASVICAAVILLSACKAEKKPVIEDGTATVTPPNTPYKTLNYLYSIQGKKTLFGMHNREPNSTPAIWTNKINETTSKFPALWSGDFLFQQDNINNRQIMINEAITQWNKGAMVNIMWHACNPALNQPCGWNDQGVLSKLSDTQWNELLTNGTPINTRWKQMMDEVAGYLKVLQDNGVEVLFRPLHEMNQGSFWWGGRPGANGTRKLYQLTHDYMVKTKGLTNLIWVWDMQDFSSLSSDLTNYNPGDDYWDVAALDIYDSSGITQNKYQLMVNIAKGKPIAIGECDKLPTPTQLAAQPKWTFFMGWSELVYEKNTVDEIKNTMNVPSVISLDEMPKWK